MLCTTGIPPRCCVDSNGRYYYRYSSESKLDSIAYAYVSLRHESTMGDDESIRLRFPFSKRFLEYWKSRKEEEEGISLMKDRRKFTVGIGVIKLGLPRESRWKSVKEMQPTYEEGLYRRAVWYFLYIRYHSILGRLDRTDPTKTVKTPIERILPSLLSFYFNISIHGVDKWNKSKRKMKRIVAHRNTSIEYTTWNYLIHVILSSGYRFTCNSVTDTDTWLTSNITNGVGKRFLDDLPFPRGPMQITTRSTTR